MSYAVISIGNKQYRVREGQRLLVDRVPHDEGKTFHPDLIMLGGDGDAKLGSDLKGQQVTAKVAEHVKGKKVIIGKHKRRTGYKRRNGFRAQPHPHRGPVDRRRHATRSTAAKKEAGERPRRSRRRGSRPRSRRRRPAPRRRGREEGARRAGAAPKKKSEE